MDTCANLSKSLTTETLLSCDRYSAWSHNWMHLSKRAWSANTAPLNITECGTSGLYGPSILSLQ